MSCNEKKEKSEAFGDIRGVTWLLSDIGYKTLNNDIKTTLVFGDEDKSPATPDATTILAPTSFIQTV